MRRLLVFLLFAMTSLRSFGAFILVPMDETQTNHLKAYGLAFKVLDHIRNGAGKKGPGRD